MEERLSDIGAAVSDWVVLLVLAGVAGLAAAILLLPSRAHRERKAGELVSGRTKTD